MHEKTKGDALKAAIRKFNKAEMTKEELETVAKAISRKVEIYDKTTQRHPNYPVGMGVKYYVCSVCSTYHKQRASKRFKCPRCGSTKGHELEKWQWEGHPPPKEKD